MDDFFNRVNLQQLADDKMRQALGIPSNAKGMAVSLDPRDITYGESRIESGAMTYQPGRGIASVDLDKLDPNMDRRHAAADAVFADIGNRVMHTYSKKPDVMLRELKAAAQQTAQTVYRDNEFQRTAFEKRAQVHIDAVQKKISEERAKAAAGVRLSRQMEAFKAQAILSPESSLESFRAGVKSFGIDPKGESVSEILSNLDPKINANVKKNIGSLATGVLKAQIDVNPDAVAEEISTNSELLSQYSKSGSLVNLAKSVSLARVRNEGKDKTLMKQLYKDVLKGGVVDESLLDQFKSPELKNAAIQLDQLSDKLRGLNIEELTKVANDSENDTAREIAAANIAQFEKDPFNYAETRLEDTPKRLAISDPFSYQDRLNFINGVEFKVGRPMPFFTGSEVKNFESLVKMGDGDRLSTIVGAVSSLSGMDRLRVQRQLSGSSKLVGLAGSLNASDDIQAQVIAGLVDPNPASKIDKDLIPQYQQMGVDATHFSAAAQLMKLNPELTEEEAISSVANIHDIQSVSGGNVSGLFDIQDIKQMPLPRGIKPQEYETVSSILVNTPSLIQKYSDGRWADEMRDGSGIPIDLRNESDVVIRYLPNKGIGVVTVDGDVVLNKDGTAFVIDIESAIKDVLGQ